MDLRKLKTLIDLVSESNVSELEITEAEGKVRIVKGGARPAVQQQHIGEARSSRPPPQHPRRSRRGPRGRPRTPPATS